MPYIHELTVNASVWTYEKKNGIVDYIDHKTKEVYVNHYDNGYAVYEIDDFFGNWDHRLNQWVIAPI